MNTAAKSKLVVSSSRQWCGIVDDDTNQCCCNCKHHLPVHLHCCTEPKPPKEYYPNSRCCCNVQKSWACALPEMIGEDGKMVIYDNWGEHACGCECYNPTFPDSEMTKAITEARAVTGFVPESPKKE